MASPRPPRTGKTIRTRTLYEESLALRRRIGDTQSIVHSLKNLASASASSERAGAAACPLGTAEALRVAISSPRSPAMQEEYQERVTALRASLGDAAFTAAWEKGQKMTWEEAVAFALENFEA